MFEGVLIAESLRPDTTLHDLDLRVTELRRNEIADPGPDQPAVWTLITFVAADDAADRLVAALAAALQEAGGWYADLRDDRETIVVYAGRVFRYPRGDPAARDEAVAYGRAHGVPDRQLDWPV